MRYQVYPGNFPLNPAGGIGRSGKIVLHFDVKLSEDLSEVSNQSLAFAAIELGGDSAHLSRNGLLKLRDAVHAAIEFADKFPDSSSR